MRLSILMALIAAPAAAQVPDPPPPPVAELPGAGRPVAISAHAARRQALLDRIGAGVVAIPAATRRDLEHHVIQDNDFRQDDYFFYLTGIETPSAWLILSVATTGQRQVTLLLPDRNPRMERWTGQKLGPGTEAARLTGIADVRSLNSDHLGRTIRDALTLSPGALYTTMYGRERAAGLAGAYDGPVENVIPILDSMRVVKDSVELAALRRAIYITTEAHKAAMQVARPGMYEYQIEATIEYTFRNLGADRVGFPSIVGSGPNSTVLHYDVNRRKMEHGDLVVMDIGAEYGQYTADVTRTIPVGGQFTARQRQVYNLVLGTQRAAMDAIRPGVTFRELNEVARRYMRDHSGDLCGAQSCDQYFVHGLSHWLGMRVHDVGGNRVLEPGMVFTVEPGIYIPEENLGVRIEDDVLVTESGCEVLSDGAPRTIEDIEGLMHSAGRPKTDGSGQ
ncbi:MAG: aminopeptidase P N-terminal domain-containing protein [Gemmatimonadota bacterium]|nr:MAG: aminopeptidase P N-terminal domain-containing protein [Gemmatimonadota bacterium]